MKYISLLAAALCVGSVAVPSAHADGTERRPKSHYKVTPRAKPPQTQPLPTHVEYQPDPVAQTPTTFWVHAFVENKHVFYRQAFVDYDACVAGGGLTAKHGGFYFGAEGLTDCDKEDSRTNQHPGKKHYRYDEEDEWGCCDEKQYHHRLQGRVGDDFDRIALYAGWLGYLYEPVVLSIDGRHEFAEDDQDVTRMTALVGYEFPLGTRSAFKPYTGAEVLLTNRKDEPCIEDAVWTLPIGVRTALTLDDSLSLFGDGSVNFSDDSRKVGVIEIGAEYAFTIGTTPFILAPSGAWVNRFDDHSSTHTYGYGWHDYGHRCRDAVCEQDDEVFVGKLTLHTNISNLF